MAKRARVYFLTAYVEYLLEQGIRTEEAYLGDASRFVRWLLSRATEEDVHRYIAERTRSKSYRARLRRTLNKFFAFAGERLNIPPPRGERDGTEGKTAAAERAPGR